MVIEKIATLQEIETYWKFRDVEDYNILLDNIKRAETKRDQDHQIEMERLNKQ